VYHRLWPPIDESQSRYGGGDRLARSDHFCSIVGFNVSYDSVLHPIFTEVGSQTRSDLAVVHVHAYARDFKTWDLNTAFTSRGTTMRAEVEQRILQLLELGHSMLIAAVDNDSSRLPGKASAIAEISKLLGFYVIAVPTSNIRKHFEALDKSPKGAVVLVILEDVPDQRTTRFLKHIADDFRQNRIGLVLPNGDVVERKLPIHCACVVTIKNVFPRWGDSYYEIADYYAFLEL
jgi:hypothetical protein